MKNCLLFLLSISTFLNAQVNFSDSEILVDLTHHSSDISSIASADLNNDGFNEIIVGSRYDSTVLFYKNIGGDIQKLQREILFKINDSFSTRLYIECKDIDADGLVDIIIANRFENKISWFKNLGNYSFANESIISTSISGLSTLTSGDIDNDGDYDLFIGSSINDNVSLFKNIGNGLFEAQQILYTTESAVNEIKLFDLDNNGFLDVITGEGNGSIYWTKNNNGVNFSERQLITFSASDGFGFDLIDINNDEFFDIVFTSESDDNLKFLLNINGITFDNQTIIDNSLEDPYGLVAKDFDNDGLVDIIVSTHTNDKIARYKNNGDSSFSALSNITTNVENPKSFLLDDLDSDGNLEIVTSSYLNNESSTQKLSVFTFNESANLFKETIINFYFGAANVVKIVDLNNDGAKDIVSGFNSIIWNKNNGDGTFSSQILISDNIESNFAYDIQIKDLNNDGFLDIIGLIDEKVEVYQNINGELFNLVFTLDVEDAGKNIEVSDINGDNLQDILVSMRDGFIPLIQLIGEGVFEFSNPVPIYTVQGNGFKNYDFKCADIDLDGDIDILIGENDILEINILKNDGNGVFSQTSRIQSIDSGILQIGDIDLDGYIDIISVGIDTYNPSELIYLKNNEGTFSTRRIIDIQSFQSINLGDINNDGFLDIVGTTVEKLSPRNEKIVYYLNNNNNFGNQNIVESLGYSENLTRNSGLGDLNNDGKIDIVSSYYFSNAVKYFYNTSILSSQENLFSSQNDIFIIYPNPSSEKISWDEKLNISNISVYNSIGELIYSNKELINQNQLNIDFIQNGLYFIIANSGKKTYTAKLVINN